MYRARTDADAHRDPTDRPHRPPTLTAQLLLAASLPALAWALANPLAAAAALALATATAATLWAATDAARALAGRYDLRPDRSRPSAPPD